MKRLIFALLACVCAFAAHPTFAQTYPDRPIRLLIPLAAGSAVDVVARIVAEKMGENLGQRIFVENQPGAAGIIGARAGASADADGYTILAVNDSIMAMIPHINSQAGYNPLSDFTPITQLVRVHWALVSHPSFAPKTIEELLELARRNPGKVDFASGGPGSPQHIAMEMFMQQTGVRLNHIPYKGATPALNDVVAGQVPIIFTALPTPLAFLSDKRLNLLGTGASVRLRSLPDGPTVSEAGVKGFEYVTWGGLVAPAKTPPSVIAVLNKAAVGALNDPNVRNRLDALGYEIVGNTPQQFAEVLKIDDARLGALIRAAGLKQ
jgi:tripartite-type tricarboxylate transporter receptor subunit TctC